MTGTPSASAAPDAEQRTQRAPRSKAGHHRLGEGEQVAPSKRQRRAAQAAECGSCKAEDQQTFHHAGPHVELPGDEPACQAAQPGGDGPSAHHHPLHPDAHERRAVAIGRDRPVREAHLGGALNQGEQADGRQHRQRQTDGVEPQPGTADDEPMMNRSVCSCGNGEPRNLWRPLKCLTTNVPMSR